MSPVRWVHTLLGRVAIAVCVLVAALITWEVLGALTREQAMAEDAELSAFRTELTLLQGTLDFALASGADDLVQMQIAAHGVDPSALVLAVIDGEDRAIAALHPERLGASAEELLGAEYLPSAMQAAQERGVPTVAMNPRHTVLVAYIPVHLGVPPGSLRAEREGVLVAVRSLAATHARVRGTVMRSAVELMLGAAIFLVALLVVGHRVIVVRVQAIISAAHRFAAGDRSARADIPGRDELAEIGAAFDAMATQVSASQRQLADSEQRYRSLVSAAPVGIVRIGVRGDLVDCNSAWRVIAGGSASDTASCPWEEVLDPSDLEALREGLRAAPRDAPYAATCRVVRAQDDIATVAIVCAAEPDPERDGCWIATVQDVSERLRAEQVRARLEAQLRQAQKLEALGTLASGVAHDFNNVLAAIIGNAELLAIQTPPDSPNGERIAALLRASQRGSALVQEVLAFGRPRPPQLRPVVVSDLLEEVARFLKAGAPGGVRVVVEAAPDVPPVPGDPDQLHRALVNLGTNAIKAMAKDGGTLTLSVDAVAPTEEERAGTPALPAGPCVRVRVRDEGVGMDAATMERIFEPFFSTRAFGQGTGLGLAVVHGVVRAHRGGIRVESAPGSGTTFFLYLPLPVAPKQPEPARVPTTSVPEPHRGLSILYVDDEEPLLELARQIFGRRGHRVTTFESAHEAIACFRADPTRWDLVVTDQRMPEMLGEQLVVALRELDANVPIVVISGFVNAADTVRILDLGATAVFEKPMSMDELVEACLRVVAAPV